MNCKELINSKDNVVQFETAIFVQFETAITVHFQVAILSSKIVIS